MIESTLYHSLVNFRGVQISRSVSFSVPVQSVVLFKNYSDSNMTFASSELPFYYSDTISGSVGCQVTGGNPRPNITVSVASAVSIPQNFIQVSRTWSGPKSGFKTPSWLVLSYTEQFRVLPDYDGEDIVCTASIYDYNVSSSNIILVNGNQIILMSTNFSQILRDHGTFLFKLQL